MGLPASLSTNTCFLWLRQPSLHTSSSLIRLSAQELSLGARTSTMMLSSSSSSSSTCTACSPFSEDVSEHPGSPSSMDREWTNMAACWPAPVRGSKKSRPPRGALRLTWLCALHQATWGSQTHLALCPPPGHDGALRLTWLCALHQARCGVLRLTWLCALHQATMGLSDSPGSVPSTRPGGVLRLTWLCALHQARCGAVRPVDEKALQWRERAIVPRRPRLVVDVSFHR
ncbi:hypothetical protein CRUP_017053 [Coryphaenoides rupestris]|nr:hypothetical protein CRUP_017053 [Coryphaenoides rupestris]